MDIKKYNKKEQYNLDVINQISNTDANMLINKAENYYHSQIEQIVSDITSNKKIKILLLAGPSSSGKTTTSNLIMEYLAKNNYHSIVISLDNFFLNRDQTPKLPNGDYDYENITALDLNCLENFIDELFKSNVAHMPVYNFVTGKREEKLQTINIQENSILIIEGIHALNPLLIKKHRDAMYKVYICANSDFYYDNEILIPANYVRLMRRCNRDYYTRGTSIDNTIKMWQNVLNGEDLYIKPYKSQADYMIDSTHSYEILMFTKYLLPLLNQGESNQLKSDLIKMLSKSETLDKEYLPENSLLREFLNY